ncbi:MAG: RNA polymerase sigma factor [Cellvibrionaceae bacterium]|nr:RNA polymerase sigma factor [Cellvibrionaceae bacterium]MCV6624775.1 RNA polymerase sigma factor [Cellvibrionaceae bacterium]
MSKLPDPKDELSRIFIDNLAQLGQYLRGFLRSPQDIEDVLQDAYIKALESQQRQVIRTPRAFLYKVCKNLALNKANSHPHQFTEPLADLTELESLFCSLELEEQLHQQQRFAAFCDALKRLPKKCRKVFILKKIYGLSNTDIAAKLDIKVSTVDKHLAKGLLMCRDDLQRQGLDISTVAKQMPTQRRRAGE